LAVTQPDKMIVIRKNVGKEENSPAREPLLEG